MYTPTSFEAPSLSAIHQLIAAYPLATLVTQGASGLTADHLPMVLDSTQQTHGVLRCHVAKANPVWRGISEGAPGLAIFHGPQAYVSPSWYPSKGETGEVVPTWNYIVAHVYGRARVIHDLTWLRAQVEALTQQQESTFAKPWSVADAPVDYIDRMLNAIVGIEFTIDRLEGKWKASQNRPEADRAGVAEGLRRLESLAMAEFVSRPSS